MEIKSIPLDLEEKGIIVLKGISFNDAEEIIKRLRRFLDSEEKKIWFALPDMNSSIEFIRLDDKQIIDIKYESEEEE